MSYTTNAVDYCLIAYTVSVVDSECYEFYFCYCMSLMLHTESFSNKSIFFTM